MAAGEGKIVLGVKGAQCGRNPAATSTINKHVLFSVLRPSITCFNDGLEFASDRLSPLRSTLTSLRSRRKAFRILVWSRDYSHWSHLTLRKGRRAEEGGGRTRSRHHGA